MNNRLFLFHVKSDNLHGLKSKSSLTSVAFLKFLLPLTLASSNKYKSKYDENNFSLRMLDGKSANHILETQELKYSKEN